MKYWLAYILLFAVSITTLPCLAVPNCKCTDGDNDKEKKKKNANEEGLLGNLYPRAKFFSLAYRNYPMAYDGYNYEALSDDDDQIGDYIKAKLRFPIFLKDDFKLIGEIGFQRERIYFPEEFGDFGKVVFQRAGIAMMAEKSLKNDFFIIGAFSISSRQELGAFKDLIHPNNFGGLILVGKSYSNDNKLAFGIASSENIGRFNISPVVSFTKRLDHHNVIEAVLPKEIIFRHLFNENFHFVTELIANGANYSFRRDKSFGDVNQLEVRRSEAALTIGIEKEIHDWLWFSVNAGVTKPIYNALVEQGQRTNRNLATFNTSIQPALSFSVFGVIPEKFMNKFKR